VLVDVTWTNAKLRRGKASGQRGLAKPDAQYPGDAIERVLF
jgi:hypothetical protein